MNLILLLVYIFSLPIVAASPHAVTYEQSPGRFGDNLLSYAHAKWISYKYKLPLLYKPFIYSNQLMLHEYELPYETMKCDFKKIVVVTREDMLSRRERHPTLYVVPYFPESKHELQHCVNFQGKPWDHFQVDWSDEGFIAELNRCIAPRGPIPVMNFPADRITVAVHLRRGGNHDDAETVRGFPLKFLPHDFYIQQLKALSKLLLGAPLYVFLFTDDNDPVRLMEMFQDQLRGFDIIFDCRRNGNSDTTNVISDFFAFKQFDCLIRSESNFSLIMNKIHGYMVSIFPDSFYGEGSRIIYNNVNVVVNKQHKKFNKGVS